MIVAVVSLRTYLRFYAYIAWGALILVVLVGIVSLANAPDGTADRIMRGEPRDPPLHIETHKPKARK